MPIPHGAMRDALRLSRGMSYKNAMAGLPMGGGKAVVLLDAKRTKTPEMLAAFGDAVDALGGRYVTAEDVGASEADMVAIAQRTPHVCGLPAGEGELGGDPGPFTAMGIYPRHQGGGGAQAGPGQRSRACAWRCRAAAASAAASRGCWPRTARG